MSIEKSIYRLFVKAKDKDRFFDALAGIRTGEDKIQKIAPGNEIHSFDLILTEEELTFLRLSFNAQDVWLQDW